MRSFGPEGASSSSAGATAELPADAGETGGSGKGTGGCAAKYRPTAESSKSRGCPEEQETVEGHQGADPAPGSDYKRRVANYRRRVAAAQEEAAHQAEAKAKAVPRTHLGQGDLNFQWFSHRAWCIFRILISKCA